LAPAGRSECVPGGNQAPLHTELRGWSSAAYAWPDAIKREAASNAGRRRMSRHRGARRPHWSKLRRLTEESRLPHGPFLAQDTPLQAQFFGHNAAVPEHNMRPLRPGTEPTPLELRGRATHLHDMGLVDEE